MSKSTLRGVGAVAVLTLVTSLHAATWHVVDPVVIHPNGTWPSVWSGTVAYTVGIGGPLMYYDGSESVEIYPASLYNYEPSLANGVIGWRNSQAGASTNEILRWDGQSIANLSNSATIVDSDPATASNGDVMWSKDHQWLMYYEAASGTTTDLGIHGVGPAVYLTSAGVLTYAYQDPVSDNVYYFDGTTTVLVGPGFADATAHNAHTSLWDGAVAYVGPGVGDGLTGGEIFYWRNGQTVRVTNDDAVGGKPDDYPSIYNNVIIWQRAQISSFQTQIFLWDGTDTTQITDARSMFPSFHDGWVAWNDSASGLYLARVVPDGFLVGDLNCDGTVGFGDINPFVQYLSNFVGWQAAHPTCPPQNGDINGDGTYGQSSFADINPFVALLTGH
jgi:hypothetical protein